VRPVPDDVGGEDVHVFDLRARGGRQHGLPVFASASHVLLRHAHDGVVLHLVAHVGDNQEVILVVQVEEADVIYHPAKHVQTTTAATDV